MRLVVYSGALYQQSCMHACTEKLEQKSEDLAIFPTNK